MNKMRAVFVLRNGAVMFECRLMNLGLNIAKRENVMWKNIKEPGERKSEAFGMQENE